MNSGIFSLYEIQIFYTPLISQNNGVLQIYSGAIYVEFQTIIDMKCTFRFFGILGPRDSFYHKCMHYSYFKHFISFLREAELMDMQFVF